MSRLIWVFAGRKCHFVGFVMRRLRSVYRNDPYYLDSQVWENSIEQDETTGALAVWSWSTIPTCTVVLMQNCVKIILFKFWDNEAIFSGVQMVFVALYRLHSYRSGNVKSLSTTKPTKWPVCPAKSDQPEYSLSLIRVLSIWRRFGTIATHKAHNKNWMETQVYLSCCWSHRWAASRQNQQNGMCAQRRFSQPVHPPSLIRVIAVHLKKAWDLSYPLSAQWRLWSYWADAQTDLSLHWVHIILLVIF